MLRVLHVKTSAWINRLDGQMGRKVWFNFWDTRLTHQKVRFGAVELRPSKRSEAQTGSGGLSISVVFGGLVERMAPPAIVKTVYRFKTDKISVEDEFEPATDW